MADNNEITAEDIADLGKTPKRVTGDEGTVEERSVKELIEADRYACSKTGAAGVPYGLRIARIRFPGTT